MSVVVIGLNHRTAPLELLERTTVDRSHLPKALHDLTGRRHLSEAVVLSTCNRTEVYAVAERFHGAFEDVRDFFCVLSHLPPEDLADHLYLRYDDEAVAHLLAVASGLDSAVLGEGEILGQVNDAWEQARDEEATGPTLNVLFRHAVEAGKRARTETAISRGITSVAQAAVAMTADRLAGPGGAASLAGIKVLVLGAGEMAEGMAVALAAAGAGDIVVANRTIATGEALAARVGGRASSLFALPDELALADVLLTSTGATSMMVDHADLSAAMAARDGRPLLIVDIAVPRDVDPAAGTLPGVTLLDMDDLRRFVAAGLEGREREAAKVRAILEEELSRYRDYASAREVAPLVRTLRDQAETVRRSELERFEGRLDGLGDRERQAIEALTRGIVAKLLHEPTVRLKDASGTPKGDRLAEALRDLFDLN